MRVIQILIVLFFIPSLCFGQWTSGRPDGHAPLGVMGDHTHGAGEFMFSYRFMYMNMDGNRDGTSRVSSDEVVSPNDYNFTISPINMPMSMHMFGLMYAPFDHLTLMVMVPLISLDMDHVTRAGGTFSTSTSGLGDVKLAGLYRLATFDDQRVHLNIGFAFPTGSIETKDVTPASAPNEAQLPYPMQLGSGTVDFMPGITYLGETTSLSWGAQLGGTVRLGKNNQDYSLGNKIMLTGWGALKLSSWLSASARLEATSWGDIDGASPAYAGAVTMRMVPTVFSDLRGGSRVDAGLGLNTYVSQGSLHGLRLAVEGLLPVTQDLNGPQLETDWQIIAGLQYSF